MNKTTCFILFFCITSFVIHAQTPPDQNFGTYEDLSYGGSVTYELITYTGSDAYVGIGDAVGEGISLSPLFSGSAVVMGGNTSGGYVGFKSASLSNNFRIVSFVADLYGHSNGNTSETYEIKGYDNGTEVVSAGNFIVTLSGSYGSGNATITWVRENYNDNGSNSGTLTFGSDWSNIDEIRFYPLDAAPYNNLFVGLDNIDFEPAVLPASAPTVSTSAESSITATGATLNGNVTSDGGEIVNGRGFVYSNSDNTPTIGETGVIQVTDGSGTGIFSEAITGLNASTTYHYQAYATNSEGTAYGGVESFTTSAPNAAPIVDANTGLTVTEETTGTIDSGKLHFDDIETGDDSQLTATITTAVAHGTLFLDANLNNTFDAGDEELTVSATFTQDDVNNDLLRYSNTADNQTSDSFVFTLSDPDGGELTNQTFNITINQVPTVTVNNGLTLNEGTTELIDSGKLNATDAETGGGTDITFTITSAVSHGILFIDSNPSNVFEAGDVELVENATFTLDDVNNDRLRYTNNVPDQAADSFEFKVSDPNGGELANQTFNITINLLEVPTVTTTDASDVTTTTATLGGEVTDNGGAAVTERGIVYNTTGTPTTADTKVLIGSGDGVFSDEINGLTAETEYFVRAYAINSEGTSYGTEESFTTFQEGVIAINDAEGSSNFNMNSNSQSFTAIVTGEAYAYQLKLNGDVTTGAYTLYEGVGTGGIQLATGAVSQVINPVEDEFTTLVKFEPAVSMTQGEKYTLYLNDVAGGGLAQASLSNPYTGGSYHSGTGASETVADYIFRVVMMTTPTVTTTAVLNVTTTTATLGGEVNDNGGATVTERGVVYNTSGTPTTADTKVLIGGSGDGVFSDEITGLTEGTTYYVRAYAINSKGTSYGNEESFSTSTLGLEDDYLKNAVSLYPNPVNDVLHLTNTIKIERVVLFNVLGKKIDTIKMENNAINVSSLESGIYLLKIETDRGNVIKRIIKE